MDPYSLLAQPEHDAIDALRFEGQTLSWSAVRDRCARIGAVLELRTRAEGGPIAVRASNRVETALTLLAAFERGITVVPLHPRLTEAEARALCEDARCTMVLDDRALDALMVAAERAEPSRNRAHEINAERPLALLYTSGTSGKPKGALLSRRAFVASAAASERNLRWGAADRWLLVLPLCHVGGLSVLTRCLFARKTVVLQRRFDERATLAAIEREGVTIASFVPTMLQRLLEVDEGNVLASLRVVLLGGAAAPNALLDRCAERGIAVRATYGMTEGCSQLTTQRARDWRTVERGSGVALEGTELEARQDDGAPCARGDVGRLWVRGPTLFSGYWQGDRRSSSDWFDTGDYGLIDAEGRVHIVARRTDLIVTGGENVYPLEVERALEGVAGVRELMVFGVEDARWGQRVACAVVSDGTFDPAVFARACVERLASHKRPRDWAITEALPLTSANKPDRRAARALFEARLQPVPYAR